MSKVKLFRLQAFSYFTLLLKILNQLNESMIEVFAYARQFDDDCNLFAFCFHVSMSPKMIPKHAFESLPVMIM